MEKTYDAIFAGTSLTALAAAALLAKRKKSILVLAPSDSPSTKPVAPSFTSSEPSCDFAEGPLSYFGFEERGTMEGLFSELGLSIPTLRKQGLLFKKSVPSLQLALPKHRIDLHPQQEEYLDELKREFGDQLQKIQSFFQEVDRLEAVFYPYLGQFSQTEVRGFADRLHAWNQRIRFLLTLRNEEKRSASSFLAPFEFHGDLLEYLNLQTLFAFQKGLNEISSYQLVLLTSSLRRGTVRMVGGYATLVRFLLKLIRDEGGEVIQGKTISMVDARGKKLSIVGLEGGPSLSCRSLVATESASKRFLNFYFTIGKEWVPSPMKENLLMTWGGTVPSEVEDLLIVRLTLPEEEAAFPPGLRGLAVTLLLRPGVAVTDPQVEALKKGALARIHWLIPFSQSEIREEGNNLKRSESPLPPPVEKDFREKAREGSAGPLRYLSPREAKNVLMIKNDLSGACLWGADVLAGVALADLISGKK